MSCRLDRAASVAEGRERQRHEQREADAQAARIAGETGARITHATGAKMPGAFGLNGPNSETLDERTFPMSAFLCSRHHIAALAVYLHRRDWSEYDTVRGNPADAIAKARRDARLLALANCESLDARYGHSGGAAGFIRSPEDAAQMDAEDASKVVEEFVTECAETVDELWLGVLDSKPHDRVSYSLTASMGEEGWRRTPLELPRGRSIGCMAHCLEYQSCEFSTYQESEARKLLREIVWCAITDKREEHTPVRWTWDPVGAGLAVG